MFFFYNIVLSYNSAMERNTKQKTAIYKVLQQVGRPLLPQQILEAAQLIVKTLSLATVYRNLKTMTEDGQLTCVHLPGEPPRFELSRHHHHHFHCHQCQRVYDIDACPKNLAQLTPAGFQVEDHELTLYGRCVDCRHPD